LSSSCVIAISQVVTVITSFFTFQVANIAPRPTESRWTFVRTRLTRAFICYLIDDLARTYVSLNPLFHAPIAWNGSVNIISQDPVHIFLTFVTFMVTPYTSIAMRHAFVAVFFVATGLSEPRDWP